MEPKEIVRLKYQLECALRDEREMRAQLTFTQARCTELLNQVRGLETALNYLIEAHEKRA